ncbi:unnamed protein product, partial [Chrysoparadoxa australica]
EIGTVTPLPQPGNPKPRLFRLKADQALINRMGFNNEGSEKVIQNLRKKSKAVIIGGNIGKNKVTPNDLALDDYQKCFNSLYPFVDYFVVNVSSPNTPGLRELQEKGPLLNLLQSLTRLNKSKASPKPLLLKIAPDLTDSQLDDILDIVDQVKLNGIIATNTTIDRSNLKTSKEKIEEIGAGGLSGAPLFDRSTDIIKYLKNKHPKLVIIAVGGIHHPEHALEKLNAGADLVQIYTGLVYHGPALIKNINRAILKNLDGG